MTRTPAPTMEDSRFVLRGLLLMAAFGGLVAIVVSVALGTSLGGRDGDGWETYRNREYGYEVRYPPDWTIEVRDPQHVRFVKDASASAASEAAPSVLVGLNLILGEWCDTARIENNPIAISGIPGEEHVCYPPDSVPCNAEPGCRDEPFSIVRFFENAVGKPSYTIVGQTSDDLDTVRRIVESFRFLD